MRVGKPEGVEHHDAVRYSRENPSKPILPIEPLDDPCDCAIYRALPPSHGKCWFDGEQHEIDETKEPEPLRALLWCLWHAAHRCRRLTEKLGDGHSPGIADLELEHLQNQQR